MVIGNCPVCGAEMRVGTDMTNADLIRAMTDEELAEWRANGQCPPNRYMNDYECNEYNGRCKDCWLDWLKREASE